MTLTMMVKCQDGFLFGADSQRTNIADNSKSNNLDKIKTKEENGTKLIYAISGDMRFFHGIHHNVQNESFQGSEDEIRDKFGEIIEDVASGLKRKEERVGSEFWGQDCSVIMAGHNGDSLFRYVYSYDGAAMDMRTEHYEVKGSGSSFADLLMRSRHPGKELEEMDAIDLSYYVLRRCCEWRSDIGTPIKLHKITREGELYQLEEGKIAPFRIEYKNRIGNMKILQSLEPRQAQQLTGMIEDQGIEKVIDKLEELKEN